MRFCDYVHLKTPGHELDRFIDFHDCNAGSPNKPSSPLRAVEPYHVGNHSCYPKLAIVPFVYNLLLNIRLSFALLLDE